MCSRFAGGRLQGLFPQDCVPELGGRPQGTAHKSFCRFQFATQDLTNEGFGQVVAKFEHFGNFVRSQFALAESEDVLSRLLCWREAGFEHDEGGHRFARVLVWHSDDGGFRYSGMLEQYLFHLAGIDVEATGDDQVFGAVNNVEVALFIHPADIAGTHPAVVEGVLSLFRAVPVAFHDVRSLDDDLAYAARWQQFVCFRFHDGRVNVGHGQTHAAVAYIDVERVAVGDGRGFAQPVALHQPAARHGLEIVAHLRGQRRRAADAVLDRT